MKRFVNWLGTFIALTMVTSSAEAGSYSFAIGGHRFHVEAPRNCRSTSCVSISSGRSFRPAEDIDTTLVVSPAPPAALPPAQVCPAAPVKPPQPTVATIPVAPPAPTTAPILAPTVSQSVTLPPAPQLEPPKLEPPQTTFLEAPHPATAKPDTDQLTTIAQRRDEPADTPLGQWESKGAKGTVRIERCGSALCGYALTETSSRGESVLVNMKPKSDGVWTGNIYSRASGNTYYGTMTLKRSGKLHVEACALLRFFCSGNDWTRIEERREELITTSQQWNGARS
ncbi:DUF2147 domain-containing protein [Bradyrhizobium neotropicale]|uniref:DUF2147 domain-containing protein n=1 Tax=Bradyrhizobium neotropicale TaxID=1497615 RepID=A0A176ZEB5_9BRAD|nr:DUF2147 domain-containing protein [Bradyrhizobium neotropicale]OAF18116.1 hypothetical protein AXW67_06330 [Bradyrhizobium neotropicale]